MQIRTAILAAAALGALAAPALAAPATPIKGVKNIIIIINDGGGHTVYDAVRLYTGRPLPMDGPGFRQVNASTYPLRPDSAANNQPGSLIQDPSVVYRSSLFWDTTPVPGPSTVPGYTTPFPQAGFAPVPLAFTTPFSSAYPAGFQGYEWSRYAHPDSGNTASSIASGVKTYNNAINVDGAGVPQVTITDLIDDAKSVGKSTGIVSTVQFSDATPAALGGAHNVARSNRTQIAAEMFSTGKLDVIAGTGNPDFNDDGLPRTPVYAWIAAPLWADVKAGSNVSGLNPLRFRNVQERADVQALAYGNTRKPPQRVAMIVRGDNSTQFNRTNVLRRADGTNIDATQDQVCDPLARFECRGTPLKTNVPSHKDLTIAALNVLGQNGRGFYLMSEAGAVDRAEHANDTARMIEEQIASDEAVQAIIDWVNRKDTAATWDDTLLIVSADHDHLLYGPDGATVAFQPVQDRGPGNVPGNRWFGPNHGTGVVPLFAYGKGADEVAALATNIDSYTDGSGRTFGYGAYLDQTTLGEVLKATARQPK